MKKTPLATITIIGLIGSLASIYALFYSGDFSQVSDGNNSPVFSNTKGSITINNYEKTNEEQCSKAPKIKQDMDYDLARELIKNAGWQSPSLPTYGYSPDDVKVTSECMTTEICNKYPEIDACGSGHCTMLFSDCKNKKLNIHTYGSLGDGAYIMSWGIE